MTSKAIAVRSKSAVTIPNVRGHANPHYIRREKAKVILRQHIKENPGRFTVADLCGLTGITTNRINRMITSETEFARFAARGMIAVPKMGRRPSWANKKTPVVRESFYKGAYAMTKFRLSGEKQATELGMRLYDATVAALISSGRAPQNVLMLQDGIREELRAQTAIMSKKLREAERAIDNTKRLVDANAMLLSQMRGKAAPLLLEAGSALQ